LFDFKQSDKKQPTLNDSTTFSSQHLPEGLPERRHCLSIVDQGRASRRSARSTAERLWMESINQEATQTQKGMQQVDQAAQNLNDLAARLTSIAQIYKIG